MLSPHPGSARRQATAPRRQPAQHPLMPLTLLDELPPARPVPVLGLLRIHRHEAHATSPRIGNRCALDTTYMSELASVAIEADMHIRA